LREMSSCFKSSSKNAPVSQLANIPLRVLAQCGTRCYDIKRRYTRIQEVDTLAVRKSKTNGRGITFEDLIISGLAKHKSQAQNTLKRCLAKRVLFVIEEHKPQQYFPSSLKSEILKTRLLMNAQVGVTEVPCLHNTHHSSNDAIVEQTLQGYVLPMLSDLPINIHKIQLKLKLTSEYYGEISLHANPWNRNKEHQEIVGSALVRYLFYPNGRVMVFVECGNTPFSLERDEDLGNLVAFLGAVRDRMVVFLHDRHERVVPGVMQWYLAQCEINRDVKIGDWMQFTGLNMQVRHALRMFRVYIKSKGGDAICRVEESISPKNKSAVEVINNIFNPYERLEKQIGDLSRKIDRLVLPHHNCVNCIPV
jgi:hypothetical protein